MSEKESKNISEPYYILATCRNLLRKYDDFRKKIIPPNLATLDNSFHKCPMYELHWIIFCHQVKKTCKRKKSLVKYTFNSKLLGLQCSILKAATFALVFSQGRSRVQ
jgi:hypothetical protein